MAELEKNISTDTFELMEAPILGDAAVGTINPTLDSNEIDNLFEALPTYYSKTDMQVVCKCIDGRNCDDAFLGPNSAGGTLCLAVMHDLTSESTRAHSFDEVFDLTIRKLQDESHPVGGHGAVGGEADHTGCGASDKLGYIYRVLVDKSAAIQLMAEQLGIDVSSHHRIIENANTRINDNTFGQSSLRKSSLQQLGGNFELLEGSHNEQLIVINTRPGTTLNRDLLGKLQIFNVDAWAFRPSVRATLGDMTSEDVIKAGILAVTYFNLATALALCGSDMQVRVI